jgi:hypothetical protein
MVRPPGGCRKRPDSKVVDRPGTPKRSAAPGHFWTRGPRVDLVPRFRLEFIDDGSEIDLEADDFDDDGEWISLYLYVPEGADPLARGTTKEVVAAFARASLAGPPRPVG